MTPSRSGDSAAAESGDSVFYYILPYLEDAVGAARGGAIGSASLTWGDVTVR